MKLYTPSRIFSVESIQAQSDTFGKQLESYVTLLMSDMASKSLSAKDVASNPACKAMEKLIFSRLGLKVHFVTHEILAAIMPFYSNKSHIFISEYFRGNFDLKDQNKLLKDFDGKKGTVNLESAKLTGIFSEYDHPLYINFTELVNEYHMSAEEIVAIMLHEQGHGFSACYFADRSDRTNQVLASVARNLLKAEGGDVEYVYAELKKVTPSVTKEAVDKMVNGGRVVAGATWFKVVVGMAQSQTLDDTYNDTSFEQQADNFASRFGYGKHLVLALDKLSSFTPEKNRALLVVAQLLSVSVTVILAMAVFAAISSGAIAAAFFFAVYKVLFLMSFREDMVDYTYDKLKFRYLRVRNDVVEQLKAAKSDLATSRKLLDNIYALDACIKETAVVKTLPAYVMNAIFSGARKADNSITDQQLLEALVSNDLFIQSAELRQTA